MSVPQEMVGEVLGSINGIKALTEGIGPITFGVLMGFFEDTPMPGFPYVIAALLSIYAYFIAGNLVSEEDYVPGKYANTRGERGTESKNKDGWGISMGMRRFYGGEKGADEENEGVELFSREVNDDEDDDNDEGASLLKR